MKKPTFPCPGPPSLRDFLRMGSLALGGAGLSNLLGRRAAARRIPTRIGWQGGAGPSSRSGVEARIPTAIAAATARLRESG